MSTPILGERKGYNNGVNLRRLQNRSRAGAPQSNRPVARCRCRHLTIRRESYGVGPEGTRMALERLPHRSSAGVSQLDRLGPD